MTVRQKINDLFVLRKLPELCANSKIAEGSVYYKGLINLQKAIYDLDAYLERTWDIKEVQLNKYWAKIHDRLDQLSVPKSRRKQYLSHIQKYQKHEVQLRDGKLPFEYSIEYFYYYKSCDVKLIRRLIYDKIPSLSKFYKLADWRLFDLITELHDDIEDVYEDLEVYNGNSFLLSINAKGLSQTVSVFQMEIDNIEKRLDEKFASSKKYPHQRLYAVTKDAIMHLNILLMKRVEELEKKPLPEAKLLRKLSLEISI